VNHFRIQCKRFFFFNCDYDYEMKIDVMMATVVLPPVLSLKKFPRKYTHRHKKRLIIISLKNDLEIIFVLIFLYYS
jgi:hypothetical protein